MNRRLSEQIIIIIETITILWTTLVVLKLTENNKPALKIKNKKTLLRAIETS
jgi:hypothetical protein